MPRAYPNMRWSYLAATSQCNRLYTPSSIPSLSVSSHTIPATAPPNTAPALSSPQYYNNIAHESCGATDTLA